MSRSAERRPNPWLLIMAAVVGTVSTASAHDVSVDLTVGVSPVKSDQLSAGNAGLGLGASYDFNASFSAWVGALYTRDFATRTPESSSTGNNIFLVSPGLLWMPGEHWSLMATASLSPVTTQRSATTVTVRDGTATETTADVVVKSVNSSTGGMLVASYTTAGLSDFESGVDVSATATHFAVTQTQEVPNTPRGNLLRATCQRRPTLAACLLINGASTPLWQVRLGATYTATLSQKADLGLDFGVFIYDGDPNEVGYFSLVALGREVGGGVPVAPVRLSAKPFFAWRWEKATLKVSWTTGLYVGGAGASQSLSVKVTWKATKNLRLYATVLTQAETTAQGLSYTGNSASLGSMVLF